MVSAGRRRGADGNQQFWIDVQQMHENLILPPLSTVDGSGGW